MTKLIVPLTFGSEFFWEGTKFNNKRTRTTVTSVKGQRSIVFSTGWGGVVTVWMSVSSTTGDVSRRVTDTYPATRVSGVTTPTSNTLCCSSTSVLRTTLVEGWRDSVWVIWPFPTVTGSDQPCRSTTTPNRTTGAVSRVSGVTTWSTSGRSHVGRVCVCGRPGRVVEV